MRQITFNSLKLVNFCGIKDAEYRFGENITIIKGRNGIGKSTIVNAIHYVLFGTDIRGNALDIKTFDTDHNIIPEIEHSAELGLSVNGGNYILKRSLTDKWKDKECKNTYKYYVNGEVTTAGDFRNVVDGICTETTLRLASSPTYFVSLPWDKQRKFLEELVPDITFDTVAQGNEKYDFVADALKSESIDRLVHHLKYQRNEIQKELDNIPVRLKELNAVQTLSEDWESLSEELSKKNDEKKSLEERINATKTDSFDRVRNESIRRKMEFLHKRIAEMEHGARNLSSDEETKHMSDVINAKKEKSQASSAVEELKAEMRGYTETEIQLKQQIESHKEEIKKAGSKYKEIYAETWHWNDNDGFCMHCGQPLPAEKTAQLKKESKEHFNADKAERLKALLDKADGIRKEHQKCKTLLEMNSSACSETTTQLTEAHRTLKEAERRLLEVEKEVPETYERILSKNDNYKQATAEIKELEESLCMPIAVDGEKQKILSELQGKKAETEITINQLTERLARKDTYERVENCINKVREDKEVYQQQLDELDKKLDIASEYYQMSCAILEDRVNEHFQFVKWSLFKSNLDGEKKPFCECYHNGVPYNRLNGAAKMNAGIDIAYTISNFYEVSVPMLLDNCESNTSPIYRNGQQIRLYVSMDEDLKFEYPEQNI